ncbi:hypothetical protein [Streptomyces sp. Ru71]|nr:hypothetical protein [Streptomyces sp. Ru71]
MQLGDLATGVVDDHSLRLTDTAQLALVVSTMLQWVDGAGA